MKRISLKIVIIIILSVIFSSLSIGVLSTIQAGKILENETYEKFRYISRSYANEFSMILRGTESIVSTVSSQTKADFERDSFRLNPEYRELYMAKTGTLLQDIALDNDYIQGIYLVINPELTGSVYESWYIYDGMGHYVYQEPEELSTFYEENEDMNWYYDPLRQKQGVWSLPYTDATIDVKMISYSNAVYSNGELIAVMGIDISFEDIQNTIEQMVFYKTGYGVLLDEDYKVIVHPVLEEGTDISQVENGILLPVIEAMEQRDSEIVDYIFQGLDKILGYSRLSNGWIFIISASLEELKKPIIRLRYDIIFIILITVLLAIGGGLSLSRTIKKQVDTLQELTEYIGEGHFDIPLDHHLEDEFARLRSSFGIMSQKIAKSHNELQEINKNMEKLAFHDPLTHLPNRRSAMDRLEKVLQEYNSQNDLCGIMSIDLDKFKDINDSMGHDAGDQLLIHITEKMRHQISNEDMLCRMGGDEFIVIFTNVPNMDLVRAMAVRLIQSASDPVTINTQTIRISCSIGIVLIDRSDADIKDILNKADKALYSVKNRGRNSYSFYKEEF